MPLLAYFHALCTTAFPCRLLFPFLGDRAITGAVAYVPTDSPAFDGSFDFPEDLGEVVLTRANSALILRSGFPLVFGRAVGSAWSARPARGGRGAAGPPPPTRARTPPTCRWAPPIVIGAALGCDEHAEAPELADEGEHVLRSLAADEHRKHRLLSRLESLESLEQPLHGAAPVPLDPRYELHHALL
eukprot:CAMPEP_0172595302 /NCGR_PEP_ID=MMETSP1068-20121228/14833_1 /TAXON_ID=35684 /ORGANISM="Pseudopedinella elastica, Strain CCMP716" /LENGTH=186 /DNA_ID=CAMNT_0013393743 /DNA_START=52 /DNA_END=609 /DNA_ORIENTATION=+